MTVPHIQTSAAAGEISPELYGEVDLKKFSVALTTARNAIVNYKGGSMSRAGFAYVGRCKQNPPHPPRAITFQFNITQGYVLEFGDHYVRFVFQGGYVLEPAITITGVFPSTPVQIFVAGTPYTNNDWVFITGVPGLPAGTYQVSGVAAGYFFIEDLYGNPINGTGFPAYVSGGTAARLYTISSPYLAIDLPYLKFSQSADVMSLTCSNPITDNEYPPYNLTRFGNTDWTLVQDDFSAKIGPPASLNSVPNQPALAPNSVPATFAWVVTAVDAKGNESIASPVAQANGVDIQVQGGSYTLSWPFVPGAKYYNVYRSPPSIATYTVDATGKVTVSKWTPVPAGVTLGFIGSSYGTSFLDTNSSTDLQQTPPTHQEPFAPGQILAVNVTAQGSGLTAITYSITTSTGVNFAGFGLLDNGQFGGFTIQNPGSLYQPADTITINGAGFASGSINFGVTNPGANDTITLNGVVWTFVTTPSGAQQTQIASTLTLTLQNLLGDLQASVNPALTGASYALDTTMSFLLVTSKTAGSAGNSYTLAASRATPSGATLTGGSGSGFSGAMASGTLTFSGNPSNGQTIVLDGITWTFVTSGASGNQTNLQGGLAATLTQLASDLNASPNASIILASYSATSTMLNVVYKTAGTAGNSYTLGGGTSGATPSAANLTGGLAPSTTPQATLVVGPETGTYPGVNTYFQQRHFFANSLNNPDTFWASQTGLFDNFDTRIPTIATDSITASPWTEQVDGIQWLVPMPGGLLALTGSRAWQILGAGSYQLNAAALTPSSVEAQPQAFTGCSATVPPIVIDHEVLYVEALQSIVRDLSWNFWVNIYTGADLTLLSSHLFLYRKILQWAWARNPYKIVWHVCDDGTMLALTFLKEQEVFAWTRHDTDGIVVSVTTVTEPPVNATYIIVERFPPGPNAAAGGGGPSATYTMEARDNLSAQASAALLAAPSPPASGQTNPVVFADQAQVGMSFDFAQRVINYSALILANPSVLPEFPVTLSTSAINVKNETPHTLWDGFGTIAVGDNLQGPFSQALPVYVCQKNIDTDAVTYFQTYNEAFSIPLGAWSCSISLSNAGSGYTHATVVISGGSGIGMQAKAIVDAGGSGQIIDIYVTNWGLDYLPTDTLTVTITGDGSGAAATITMTDNFHFTQPFAGSDGTWRRIYSDYSYLFLGNNPILVDPRTSNIFMHSESCILYQFQKSDNYSHRITPYAFERSGGFNSTGTGVTGVSPVALGAGYTSATVTVTPAPGETGTVAPVVTAQIYSDVILTFTGDLGLNVAVDLISAPSGVIQAGVNEFLTTSNVNGNSFGVPFGVTGQIVVQVVGEKFDPVGESNNPVSYVAQLTIDLPSGMSATNPATIANITNITTGPFPTWSLVRSLYNYIAGYTVTNFGNYTLPPTITVSGTGGGGATAIATVSTATPTRGPSFDSTIPLGIDSNWVYAFPFVGSDALGLNVAMCLVPKDIQPDEVSADSKLAYVIYTSGSFLNDVGFKLSFGVVGEVYVLSVYSSTGVANGNWQLRLSRFNPPSVGSYGSNPQGKLQDVTSSYWGPATGPNLDGAAYKVTASGPFPSYWSSMSLMRLPATGQMAMIFKFLPQFIVTSSGDTYVDTKFSMGYLTPSTGTFEYHSGFITGYMSATWTPTNLAGAAYAVVDYEEINPYLDQTDFVYPGVDYTTRWFFFDCYAVTGGVVGSNPMNVLVLYKFVAGAAPQVLKVIPETGWDSAYAAYGTAIGETSVVIFSRVESSRNNDFSGYGALSFFRDSGLWDPNTQSWWFSGLFRYDPTSPYPAAFNNMFHLNSAFTSRATYNTNVSMNNQDGIVTPPFLRLTIGQTSAPEVGLGPGAYMMERMDNRLWSSIEDVYAVDAGVSNPLSFPAANLYASSTTGGVIFTADEAVFATGMIGWTLRMAGGIATINSLNSTQVGGTWILDGDPGALGTPFSASGDWSIGEPVTTLYAPHMIGASLVGLADGVPIGPLVPTGQFGATPLPFSASNVKIGLPFTTQIQSVYANGPEVIQGARKMIPAVTVRFAASSMCQVGTNEPDGGSLNPQQLAPPWTDLTTMDPLKPTGGQAPPLTYMNQAGLSVTALWTGDLRVVGESGAWESKGQVAIQQTSPLPIEVTAMMPELLDGDLPERGYSQGDSGGQPQGGPPQQGRGGPSVAMLKGPRI